MILDQQNLNRPFAGCGRNLTHTFSFRTRRIRRKTILAPRWDEDLSSEVLDAVDESEPVELASIRAASLKSATFVLDGSRPGAGIAPSPVTVSPAYQVNQHV